MRFWALFTVLTLVATLAPAQDKKELLPIPEIKLDRKDPLSYEKDIEPILASKCLYCHSGNVIEGRYDMSSHAGVMKGGKRGAVIVPGKADLSILYHFSSRKIKPIMPPKSEEPLDPQELALVKLWIDQGAKAPNGVKVRPKVALTLPPALVKPVRAIAVFGTTVAAGRGNAVYLWDAKDGQYLKTFSDPLVVGVDKKPIPVAHMSLVESMAFSPDGKTLATGSYQEVVLWDVEKASIRQRLTGFVDRVVALSWSPDGKLLATGGGAPTEDGELKVFDAAGKQLLDIKPSHSDTVFGVSFSPDGTKLASCGADKFVKVFEIPSGKLLKSFEGHTHHVLGIGWKADGKFLASGGADNSLKIWDYEKGEQSRTVPNAHTKQITSLTFAGKTIGFLTTSGDASVKLWNVDNGGQIRQFAGGADFLYAAASSADGKVVVTGGEEGLIRIYNGETAALIKVAYPPGEEPKKDK